MIYILASTKRAAEFDTADAINAMGGVAVVPRRVDIITRKDGKRAWEYRPFLPNYLFLTMPAPMWHQINFYRLFGPDGILPPVRKQLELLPRTWSQFQDFAQRAETACDRRIEQFEADMKVATYRRGEKLRILGDMLDGQLRDKLATFMGLDKQGRIIAEVPGLEIMGKPVKVTLQPTQAMAAE